LTWYGWRPRHGRGQQRIELRHVLTRDLEESAHVLGRRGHDLAVEPQLRGAVLRREHERERRVGLAQRAQAFALPRDGEAGTAQAAVAREDQALLALPVRGRERDAGHVEPHARIGIAVAQVRVAHAHAPDQREVARIGGVVARHAVAHHPVAHAVGVALEDGARPLELDLRDAQSREIRKRLDPMPSRSTLAITGWSDHGRVRDGDASHVDPGMPRELDGEVAGDHHRAPVFAL
jgi:hypothetical protein